ncbi:MAG: hypothetical protein PHI35_00350 [Victivallaceae bacterium]|nr:hypothetical protein [Victivallaceae bacterium]
MLKIGHAEADISTAGPVHLLGQFYMRINQGILDPVTAHAAAFDDGREAVIMLSVDTEEICDYLTDEICERVRKIDKSVPVDRLIVNATHTHGAPSYCRDDHPGLSEPSQFPHPQIEIPDPNEYRAELVEKLAAAICRAWQTREPGGIAYGYGYAVVGHSRRVCYSTSHNGTVGIGRNGSCQMYGQTGDADFSHFENGAGDPTIQLLYTFDAADHLTGAIINIPCPFQLDECIELTTASFANEIRQSILKQHPNINILLQSGAGGDVSPRRLYANAAENRRFRLKYPDMKPKTPEWFARLDIAERVSTAFDEVLGWAQTAIEHDPVVKCMACDIALSTRTLSAEERQFVQWRNEQLQKQPYLKAGKKTPAEILRANSARRSYLNLAKEVLSRKSGKTSVNIHAASIGDVALVSLPFELYQDYQYRIQARSPFVQTFLIQMANASCGYISTERADAGQGYSAGFLNTVSPRGGTEYVEQVLTLLQTLQSNNDDKIKRCQP